MRSVASSAAAAGPVNVSMITLAKVIIKYCRASLSIPVASYDSYILGYCTVNFTVEASASPQAPLRPKHSASRTVRDEPRCRDAAPEEGQREVHTRVDELLLMSVLIRGL